MTDDQHGSHGDSSPRLPPSVTVSPAPDLSIRIPKNKSTGNLLATQKEPVSAAQGRLRFSFDAGTQQGANDMRRPSRPEHDYGLGMSGLRRIRRPPAASRTPTMTFSDADFEAPSLQHASTLPVSTPGSRNASMGHLMSGPSSPVLEDLQRFPAESLHSFSFTKQSEEYLHSRQNILQKSIAFVRDRPAWTSNPALAEAQARASGDVEMQSMMELLRKAKVLKVDTKRDRMQGLGLGPLTGPAHMDSQNVFEQSFGDGADSNDEAVLSPLPTPADPNKSFYDQKSASEQSFGSPTVTSPGMEMSPTNTDERMTSPRRFELKRTYTDLSSLSLQQKLIEALAQPYSHQEQTPTQSGSPPTAFTPKPQKTAGTSVHTHSSKWSPAAQAVFRTASDVPWTILAANDLACLIFGVTRAEVRSLSILGVIAEERRKWLEEKLGKPVSAGQTNVVPDEDSKAKSAKSMLGTKSGITARLLSKAPSRVSRPAERSQTEDGSGGYYRQSASNHPPTKSRGVLLCGDIVPIQKRNGSVGSASFWVMEKRGGLIWVIEEINEDVASLIIDDEQLVMKSSGDCEVIWGQSISPGTPLRDLVPELPSDFPTFDKRGPSGQSPAAYCMARNINGLSIPSTISSGSKKGELRVSSLPHIAGMMVLNPGTLTITSANSVFSAALFGYDQPAGVSMCTLIPDFKDILTTLTEEDDLDLTDGLVLPEHTFRRARALLALREGSEDATSIFMRPKGLPARHRDGSDMMVDVQMRVVRSETVFPAALNDLIEAKNEAEAESAVAIAELVFAVWITYSRQLHALGQLKEPEPYQGKRPFTPPTQPNPPEHVPSPPPPASSDESGKSNDSSELSLLSPQMSATSIDEPLDHPPPHVPYVPHDKKTINDFIILEEMGSGAYGQVKLGRYRKTKSSKVVLKYVTKKRILVDTWTRDRRLGTVPLEIHVMDYLRKDGLRHPNIVEMLDFFEDDINYYIEMMPHGIPGMDLFDYIELRSNMEEAECKNIFRQVVDAIDHLHNKAGVVHRDIKDENVVLDGEGRIKLIDFGSAAYLKNGPFDVFVGTIDYAAPEVLQGKAYGGKEQDVWALGILLYTMVYKENPFYNIDEILDHPLRVPYVPFSEDCIDLIRKMLDRDVEERLNIQGVAAHAWLAEK